MYRGLKVAVSIPAYNEELLITKTLSTLPEFVDYIYVTNDGSADLTLEVLTGLAEVDRRITVFDNDRNRGVGYSVVRGLKAAVEGDADLICVMAADAQCDPAYLAKMCDEVLDTHADYVKANRFTSLEALRQMPRFRRIGNIVITLINKFATGYYSIFDSQNGYGVFTRAILERLPFELIGERYDYENTLLLSLGVVDARVKDHPVPAVYGDEVSTIKLFPTVRRALSVCFAGFWRRIYFKYVVFNFHPLALFLFAGLTLAGLGTVFGLVLIVLRVVEGSPPTSGTVMLSVLPILVGFQLMLTAIIMDVNNEKRP